MKNQNKSIGVALKVFHKKSDLQNYEGTYYLHKKGSIYPDTYNNVCSVYEAKKRLAKTFLLDIKNVEAYITKDNIHLYYELMSDEDLKKYANILNIIFLTRLSNVLISLGLQKYAVQIENNYLLETNFNGSCYIQSLFGVKDTLKPMEEYIAEIKASKEYQAHISSKLA